VQLSHIQAAVAAGEAVEGHMESTLCLHSVRLSPVSDSYGKPGLWPIKDRMHLLHAAIQEAAFEKVMVDTWEAEQPQFLRTYQVAQHLREGFKVNGEADVLLLAGGADLFEGMFAVEPCAKIPKPWTADSVDNLVCATDGFVVVARAGSKGWEEHDIKTNLQTKLKGLGAVNKLETFIVIVVEERAGDGSSTEVRNILGSDLPTSQRKAQLAKLVGDAVAEQISCNEGYYRSLVIKN